MELVQAWRRWGGCWFAGLYLLGLLLTSYNAIPGVDARSSDLTTFYADSGNRWQLLIGAISLAVAAAVLLGFVGALTTSVEDRAFEASVARSAASLFAACIGLAGVTLGLVAGEVALRNVAQPSPELERWLAELGYGILLVPGMAAAAVMVWALSRLTAPGGRPVSLVVAALCIAALPIAIVSELPWSQLPLALWVVAVAVVPAQRQVRSYAADPM